MSNRKNRGWITEHGKDDEGYSKYRRSDSGKGKSIKYKSSAVAEAQAKAKEAKEEREAAEAEAKAERDAITAAAVIEKQEREAAEAAAIVLAAAETAARLAAEAAAQAERDAIAAAAVIEKQEREAAEAASEAARLALAAETAAKAAQSQDERDQLFAVSESIYLSENQTLGTGSLNSITPRDTGDPYYIDDDYDSANDTYLYAENVAIGYWALSEHTKPILTVAIGAYSQEDSIYDAVHDGPDPTNSPYNLGNRSVSVGAFTLGNGTTQSRNTAVGYRGLSDITTGYDNVGIGSYALRMNTVATRNTAVGSYANAYNTTGWGNVAVGYSSLLNCTNSGNVSVGYKAGQYLVNAWYNTLIGQSVAQSLTTGTNNIVIGNLAEPTHSAVHNEITLGDSNIGNIRCNQQSFSSLSDSRDKAEITDIPEDAGLQFIDKLRPVTFYWDRREWYSDNTSDGSKMNKVHSEETSNSGQRMGFIAQEVLEVVNEYKYIKESGMVSESNPEKLEFALGSLVTPLVKAVQQLSEQNKELLNRITILEQK